MLKFAIDKFGYTIARQDVEIETDCQALLDFLKNDKLQAHHAHWKEAVLGQMIVATQHCPGVMNKVANGLSIKWSEHVGGVMGGKTGLWTWDGRHPEAS